MSWVAIHARVGGNLQDLLNRSCLAVLGRRVGDGNPYVMAVFAGVYMFPDVIPLHAEHPCVEARG
ncbi:hypothetical protein MY3296_010160 [Beauveria thailandica]